MTAGDREAIEALMRRVDHVASIAMLISSTDDSKLGFIVGGMGEMLTEAAEKIDRILCEAKIA